MTVDLIAEFESHLRLLDRTDATIKTYGETLRQMDKELPYGLVEASDDELRGWIFNPGWARATRALRRAAAIAFFGWATDPDRPRLDYNPAERLPKVTVKPSRRRAPDTAHVADILKRAGNPCRDWMIPAAYAGARCCEIAELDREDIGRDVTLLHGKGRKERRVPTHPVLWQWALLRPPGPVALDRDGRTRLTRRQISSRGNARLAYLGHRGITMHSLRRWFGTRGFDACKDIRAVQELLGHASLSTTQLYVEVSRTAMEQAVRGLPSPN